MKNRTKFHENTPPDYSSYYTENQPKGKKKVPAEAGTFCMFYRA
jgi:hypothetical protein